MKAEGVTGPAPLSGEIARLADHEQRRTFFRRRPELVRVDLVETMCSEVTRLFGVDLEQARGLADTARWLAEALDDDASRARSARATANVAQSLGDSEDAHRLYRRALDLFEELGADLEAAVTRSSALSNLAFLGRHNLVSKWYEDARGTFERLGDRRRLATLENNAGMIHGRQDRWERALESYRFACEESRRLDRPQDVAICLRNVAVCQINLHDFAAALEAYEEGRAFCQEHGLTRVLLQIDYNIAYLYYLRGEYTRAIQLFQAARRECEAAEDEYHTALCDLDMAEIYLELNLVDEAASLARAAVTTFERLKISYEGAKALTFRAIAVSRLGRGTDALQPILEQSLQPILEQSLQPILEAVTTGEAEAVALGSQVAVLLDQESVADFESMELPAYFGHGTMVAGLVRLAAPGAAIMPLRVFNGSGSAHLFDIIRAIYYAVDHGAGVINMSFSMPEHSTELQRAIQYARAHGVVCVASAGNQGERTQVYPAAFSASVGVAATTLDDQLSEFSNYGSALVDLAAPGSGIVSTYPGGLFGAGWGTSFSAPLVAGAAALIHHQHAGGDVAAFQGLVHDLRRGSETIQDLAGDIGSGRLDVAATVAAAGQ